MKFMRLNDISIIIYESKFSNKVCYRLTDKL